MPSVAVLELAMSVEILYVSTEKKIIIYTILLILTLKFLRPK